MFVVMKRLKKNAFHENTLIIFRKITILLLLFKNQNIYHDLSFSPIKLCIRWEKTGRPIGLERLLPKPILTTFWLPWKFYNPAKGSIIIFNICEESLLFLKIGRKVIMNIDTFSGSFRKWNGSGYQWGDYATCQVLSFLTIDLKMGYGILTSQFVNLLDTTREIVRLRCLFITQPC